jgi:hypothetical protein
LVKESHQQLEIAGSTYSRPSQHRAAVNDKVHSNLNMNLENKHLQGDRIIITTIIQIRAIEPMSRTLRGTKILPKHNMESKNKATSVL